MPIYEYICSNCKRPFELIRGYNRRDDPSNCEHCGQGGVHTRKVSDCHFQFEGGMPSYIEDSPVMPSEDSFDYHAM